jgi:hypothetical protein
MLQSSYKYSSSINAKEACNRIIDNIFVVGTTI